MKKKSRRRRRLSSDTGKIKVNVEVNVPAAVSAPAETGNEADKALRKMMSH